MRTSMQFFSGYFWPLQVPITLDQGGRGYWTVNYTGTQRFINYSLAEKLWVLLLNFIWLIPY